MVLSLGGLDCYFMLTMFSVCVLFCFDLICGWVNWWLVFRLVVCWVSWVVVWVRLGGCVGFVVCLWFGCCGY